MKIHYLMLSSLFLLASLRAASTARAASHDEWKIKSASAALNGARITLADRRVMTARPIKDQKKFENIQVDPDCERAGWLIDYPNPDGANSDYLPGKLAIWRAGHIEREFASEQVFYSWSFVKAPGQVAFHTGPLHGEQESHCELHEISSGKLLANWQGDLHENTTRPDWVRLLR